MAVQIPEKVAAVKYEKTQKGNPHQLTIMQHCFPRRSIARFGRSDGTVDVLLKKDARTFRVKPDAPLFCARRSWDQRAESGFMKEVEDAYQELADRISEGTVSKLCKADYAKISDHTCPKTDIKSIRIIPPRMRSWK